MAESGKYLYCIIRSPENRTFGASQVGNGNGDVHTVSHDGLAVVVSGSPVKQFENTRTNMMAHQKVQETVMREFTLLPVRFGTVANSESPMEDIRKLLSLRSVEFCHLLEDMEGKVELGIKAFWRDEKAIFSEIVEKNPEIRKLRNSLAGKPPAATHFERAHLGEMVKDALGRNRAKEAAGIIQPLSRIACDVRENEVLADRVITNTSFLVDKEREPEFDRTVKELDDRFGDRIALKYVGTIPPYNFVNIVINWDEIR
ncbi:MAG: GvpL/GvpF family gas vesicle protein [Chloroflexi bacterium]|nr:GvpL/GvpF family gas vesicle protein [Chloroflexota bacterium]